MLNKSYKGFTLMEVLVGVALLLVIFIGVYGLIQLGFKMVGQSKARVTASSLANEKMEVARNLSFAQIGTVGGIPPGSIPETENVVRNRISYTVKTTVVYIDDPFDGLGAADPLPLDYKRVKVKVTWEGFLGGEVFLQTDVAPQGIESAGGGGIISVLVFNAGGEAVAQADIHIENTVVAPPIDAHYETNDEGLLFLPGAPVCGSCYKITATKTGYSTDRTYEAGELIRGVPLTTPIAEKQLVSVMLGKTSEVSFSIDKLATKTVKTQRYVEEKIWSDTFDDETKISDKNQTQASSTLSAIILADEDGQYPASGDVTSVAIVPTSLAEWGRLNWTDEEPASTEIRYQLLYSASSSWELIPDSDLTVGGVKNSEGFPSAPIDLSELDASKYHSLKIKANLASTDPAETPRLLDWEVTWFSSDTTTPVPNIAFTMTGGKILGTDEDGNPVYKYQENLSTNGSGEKTVSDLEWDSYTITISGAATGYDIANSFPTQPVSINPDISQTTVLRLANHQTNTLLVTVQDAGGLSLSGATVRLYKSGYDKQKITSDSGQTFFSPLSSATYNLDVKLAGYQDWSGTIDVSGQSGQAIVLTPP
jgi:prepilin-type N-terminal cleavage/methylation domain-containing protein